MAYVVFSKQQEPRFYSTQSESYFEFRPKTVVVFSLGIRSSNLSMRMVVFPSHFSSSRNPRRCRRRFRYATSPSTCASGRRTKFPRDTFVTIIRVMCGRGANGVEACLPHNSGGSRLEAGRQLQQATSRLCACPTDSASPRICHPCDTKRLHLLRANKGENPILRLGQEDVEIIDKSDLKILRSLFFTHGMETFKAIRQCVTNHISQRSQQWRHSSREHFTRKRSDRFLWNYIIVIKRHNKGLSKINLPCREIPDVQKSWFWTFFIRKWNNRFRLNFLWLL